MGLPTRASGGRSDDIIASFLFPHPSDENLNRFEFFRVSLRSTPASGSWTMIKTIFSATFCLIFFGAMAHAQVIPSDRNFPWSPGMMSKGGIPNRTTICANSFPKRGR